MSRYENNIINYILLTLICMNFLQSGSIVLVVFCLYNFFFVEKYVNGLMGVLFLMSISMLPIILTGEDAFLNEAIKTVNYVLPFFVGFNGYLKAFDKTVYIKRVLFSMFLGYSLQTAFTYLYNLSIGTENRVLISIWTDERASATLIGLLSAFVIGYSFSIILFGEKKVNKLVCTISIVFVVLINIRTATRTPFLMMLLVAVFFLALMMFEKSSKNKIRYLSFFVFLGLLLFIVLSLNLFGFRDYILSSNLFERFNKEGLETGRIEITKGHFKYMFDYPWGGGNISQLVGMGAHNIWQQCYDMYGIITCFFLLVVTVSIISQLIKLIRLSNKKTVEYSLIGVYFTMLVQMCLEPILTGYPIIFWGLIFIHGITIQYYKDRVDQEVFISSKG